jgi:cysteine desulfurase/selenocysteine lyase
MPADFAALRREFPTTARWAHFDIARKAPLPRCVEAAMHEFMEDVYQTAGARSFSMEEVERARETLAGLVDVPPATLAFIRNTSEGLNLAARGLRIQPGEKVLITEFEHENNVFPWRRLEAQGVEVEIVRSRDGRIPAEAVIASMDSRTRAVAVSWVAYGNGYRMDIPVLGAECRRRGAALIVDGIQGVGVLNMPLSRLGADVVVCGGHKALLGLAGAGFLYCREEWIPRLDPVYAAKFSFASNDKWQKPLVLSGDAHRFEYGNPNFLGIHVLRRSAEFIRQIGLDAIEERVRSLTTRLMSRAEEKNIPLYTPKPWEERAGIVSMQVPDPDGIRQRLYDEHIITSVKDGRWLRAASHFYNTEEEIDRLVEIITACLDEAGR